MDYKWSLWELHHDLEEAERLLRNRRFYKEADAVNYIQYLMLDSAWDLANKEMEKSEEDEEDEELFTMREEDINLITETYERAMAKKGGYGK